MLRKSEHSPVAPIFILGPPRAGTTLIYQALVCRYRVAYFCNLANKYSLCPAFITWLAARTVGISPPQSFESTYGESAARFAPSQGNRIWARWFPGPQQYYSADEVSEQIIDELRQTVLSMQSALNCPFANKSIGHSVRINPLIRAFPTLVILRLRRDPQQIAESILCGRREYFGDESQWFSVRPRDFDRIKCLSPIQQVCEQVRCVEQDIDLDSQATCSDRVFDISYEAFCKSPRILLADFAQFYHRVTGLKLQPRREIPEAFTVSTRKKVSDAEREAIIADFQRMECTG